MIARGVLPRSRLVPGRLAPLGALAVVLAILALWAVLDVRVAGNGGGGPAAVLPRLEAVAYLKPAGDHDVLYVQRASAGALASPVATFSAPLGLHSRGVASPDGSLAVILRADATTGRAALSVLDLRTLALTTLANDVDYLTNVAWRPDGEAVAVTSSGPPTEAGLVAATIWEIDLRSGAREPVVGFDHVFEAEPVGYVDGVLYAVAIDQSGSFLYSVENGEAVRRNQLSVGKTRNWVFEPGAARLAYLDVIGAGAGRAVIARVLLLATGEITSIPGEDDQVGVVWRRGAELPDVGGPGGTLRIAGAERALIVPVAWDPRGERLLARVSEGAAPRDEAALEVLSSEGRLRLADGEVMPLGWVVDEH